MIPSKALFLQIHVVQRQLVYLTTVSGINPARLIENITIYMYMYVECYIIIAVRNHNDYHVNREPQNTTKVADLHKGTIHGIYYGVVGYSRSFLLYTLGNR